MGIMKLWVLEIQEKPYHVIFLFLLKKEEEESSLLRKADLPGTRAHCDCVTWIWLKPGTHFRHSRAAKRSRIRHLGSCCSASLVSIVTLNKSWRFSRLRDHFCKMGIIRSSPLTSQNCRKDETKRYPYRNVEPPDSVPGVSLFTLWLQSKY